MSVVAQTSGSLGLLQTKDIFDPVWDYGLHTILPDGFGDAEFTLELWLKLDETHPVGECAGKGRLTNWCTDDEVPHSSHSWWFDGNWLLDGHNNAGWARGSFDLQIYGSGRLRWLFGDGGSPGPGDTWAVQPAVTEDAASLLDGAWHHVTLVRRWVGGEGSTDARLEQWIDGALVAATVSDVRTDMAAAYWDDWALFPEEEPGWFWGVEKGVVTGGNALEDYKGLVDEVRFWSRAKSEAEIMMSWYNDVIGTEPGLVGLYRLNEGMGNVACDELASGGCVSLFEVQDDTWSVEQAPFTNGSIFADGFESGDLSRWN